MSTVALRELMRAPQTFGSLLISVAAVRTSTHIVAGPRKAAAMKAFAANHIPAITAAAATTTTANS